MKSLGCQFELAFEWTVAIEFRSKVNFHVLCVPQRVGRPERVEG